MTRFWAVLASCIFVGLSLASGVTQTTTAPPQENARSSHQPQQLKVTEYSLSPDQLAKSEALFKTQILLYLFSLIFGIAVLWILLKLRVATFFRDLAERVTKNSFVQALIFVSLLLLLVAIISIPIDIYQQHISRAYGLSVQGWGSWLADWLKGEGVSIVISVIAVFGLFKIIQKSPQRWWFYFWLITLPFVVLLIFVAPIILDPMFNKFEPLEKNQPQLVTEIEKVTQRGGLSIPRDRMFEMAASEKVTTYNAYVTGLGATKRVVVWDNTSRDMTIPETLFVFGHEMGHYVLNHIYKGLAFFAAMIFVGFWLGRKMVLAMLARWGDAWRIRSVDDLAALPVFMLVLSILIFIFGPIGNKFSRYQEHEADIYGLEVTHGLFPDNREVAASAFQKLGEKSFDYPNPNPLIVVWAYSHPSIQERVRFSLGYDPWHSQDGPKFVK